MKQKALQVIEKTKNFEFYEGTTKDIVYVVKNINHYMVSNIQKECVMINADTGSPVKGNYIKKVSGLQKMLNPGRKFELTVTVVIPEDYDETYKKDGEDILVPLDLSVKTFGTMYVKRSDTK